MARVTYVGDSHLRIIEANTFEDQPDDLVWEQGETITVPDAIAEEICETMRSQFRLTDETTKDMRSKAELYEVAQDLQLEGRSTMSLEELRDAVQAAEAGELEVSGDEGDDLDA